MGVTVSEISTQPTLNWLIIFIYSCTNGGIKRRINCDDKFSEINGRRSARPRLQPQYYHPK